VKKRVKQLSASKLDLAGVIRESIVDGPGFRFVVFCQGCPHDCPGCHNMSTHEFHCGKQTDIGKILDAVDEDPLLQGVTFSGGEPFCQAEALADLAQGIKAKERPLDIVTFTGYTYEELLKMSAADANVGRLMGLCDLIIDGRYVEAQRDLSLKFRGSRNQRIIDMQATRREGKIVLAEEYMS
jgi:anaerobic ribonucleoside-triphosphate reductase activating protein